MSLQGAIEWIQDQALTLAGVGAAHDYLTELSAEVNLSVVTWAIHGEITTASSGWGRDFHDIAIEILTTRTDLQEAMKRLVGWPDNLARLIQADTTLGSNVETFESIVWDFVPLPWSGMDFIGYRMTINRVKTLTTH